MNWTVVDFAAPEPLPETSQNRLKIVTFSKVTPGRHRAAGIVFFRQKIGRVLTNRHFARQNWKDRIR